MLAATSVNVSQLADADAWIGRAINVAKRVEAVAEGGFPDLSRKQSLELIDLPFYEFSEAGIDNL